MKRLNILIVEDESIVAMEIESFIQTLDYTVVDICSNAQDALHCVETEAIDIVLMDICLKGEKDGVDTAKEIKEKKPQTEIIFLTAHLDDYNVDRAVNIDPVAYLAKPFNRDELRVFLKIASKKIDQENFDSAVNSALIKFDNTFAYNPVNHSLYCCDEIINLTKKENDLLELLIANKNNLVDFYTIENSIWPDKMTTANTIRTLVKRLRQKLNHKFIKTVSSRGYKIILDT